jgi:myosin heavy subunit
VCYDIEKLREDMEMYDEINQQLEAAQDGIFRLQKIDAMLIELNDQKGSLEKKAEELKEILDKEDIDVEKLEGKSLMHMFHSILGNLEERMIKERQEALAARLKYDQSIRDLDSIQKEITKLSGERTRYEGSQALYQEQYNRKKSLLKETDSETARAISDISSQIRTAQNSVKEIREAVTAGTIALSHLKKAADSLDSAAGWGTWDLLGGGLLTDMAKHSRIDDAKSEAEEAQSSLVRFRTELADVKIDSTINIDIGGFSKFADFFFDGLIADWCMQSRIHDSQDSVESVKNQVENVLYKLGNMEAGLVSYVGKLNNDLDKLIIEA